VNWINTTNTTSGDSATVTYDAHQRTPQTEAAWTILMPFAGLFGLFGLISTIRALWQYIAEVFEP